MSVKNVTFLTGAGISAESGIPTFRGPEGYWSVGSREYQPQEMATYAMFCQHPDEVWKWYLYRLGVCQDASPNDGHKALVELETYLQ
ncbi:MAG: RNA polymerase subunit sigma, partial [Gammaproteobacteria bacterium]|nr:RNA polymerase subunit sigma [Gammaproteobacteria bacterium]